MIKKLVIVGIITLFILLALGCAIEKVDSSEQETEDIQTLTEEVIKMKLTSSAFQNQGTIPEKYTCDGANINPPLEISEISEGTQSLVLIMDDPDVPAQIREDQMFDHWVHFNIPPSTTRIEEGSRVPGVAGSNTKGTPAYTGPCPPPQYQPSEHRYFFKLYALDITLDLAEGATKAEVMAAMQGHVLAQTELMGKYDRS